MTYFADLTPHTYVQSPSKWNVLNIGWLDSTHGFRTGETPKSFRATLKDLCLKPIFLHRGFHVCELCPAEKQAARGNGQIRVVGKDGVCFAAPALVGHYVTEHSYQPPEVFIEAVLSGHTLSETDERPAPN